MGNLTPPTLDVANRPEVVFDKCRKGWRNEGRRSPTNMQAQRRRCFWGRGMFTVNCHGVRRSKKGALERSEKTSHQTFLHMKRVSSPFILLHESCSRCPHCRWSCGRPSTHRENDAWIPFPYGTGGSPDFSTHPQDQKRIKLVSDPRGSRESRKNQIIQIDEMFRGWDA